MVSPGLTLNALPVSVGADSQLKVWVQPYVDTDHLATLRRGSYETALVRRNGPEVEVVPYETSTSAPGEERTVILSERTDLVEALLIEWLLRSMRAKGMSCRKDRFIRYVSFRSDADLLAPCLPRGVTVPDGVALRISADLDVRRLRDNADRKILAITIGIRKRVMLDATVEVLVAAGLNPRGFYVLDGRRGGQRPGHLVHRPLAGRVVDIRDGILTLDDHAEALGSLAANVAYLEPRMENLDNLLRVLCPQSVDQILDKLETLAAQRLSGPERLKMARGWFGFFRRQSANLAQGVGCDFAPDFMSIAAGTFPASDVLSKPQLVFDVSGVKTSNWNQGGLDKYGPFNWERFTPRQLSIAVICQASRQGEVEQFVRKLIDGVPRTPAEVGFIRRFHLDPPYVRFFTTRSACAEDYRAACGAALGHLTEQNNRWNLALVQIDERFHELDGDENPYLVAKAFLLSKDIAVQQFERETIVQPDASLAYTVNNIGLACYAKVGGIPWVLPVHQTVAHELIIGVGSYVPASGRLGGRERYVGVTTVFSADGRYLLETRTRAVSFGDYAAELLAALERVVSDVRQKGGWDDQDPVRLIFHVFKPLKYTEVDAVRGLMKGLGLPHVEFAFLHVVDDHPYAVFDERQQGVETRGKRKGAFAPERGLRVRLAEDQTLVCLKGPRELKQWTDGLPRPVLLSLHPESTFRDLDYLARQVFDFSCLSWRRLLPSPTPITVLYSDLVAKNLQLLAGVSGWSSEHVLGPIGRTRWFL